MELMDPSIATWSSGEPNNMDYWGSEENHAAWYIPSDVWLDINEYNWGNAICQEVSGDEDRQ